MVTGREKEPFGGSFSCRCKTIGQLTVTARARVFGETDPYQMIKRPLSNARHIAQRLTARSEGLRKSLARLRQL